MTGHMRVHVHACAYVWDGTIGLFPVLSCQDTLRVLQPFRECDWLHSDAQTEQRVPITVSLEQCRMSTLFPVSAVVLAYLATAPYTWGPCGTKVASAPWVLFSAHTPKNRIPGPKALFVSPILCGDAVLAGMSTLGVLAARSPLPCILASRRSVLQSLYQ